MTEYIQPSHNFTWRGRHDVEDGKLGSRVHHVMQCKSLHQLTHNDQAVSLLGFGSDAGVARNKGRSGARQAPDLIRQALANMAWHQSTPLYDLGNITCQGDQLEHAQSAAAGVICAALPYTPIIVLGGGHEVAWATFQGLAGHLQQTGAQAPRIGIINFDAHFDLRAFESDTSEIKPSSGTPFYQIQRFCAEHNWCFHYACLGVSRASNTAALFERADELGVWYVEDKALSSINHIYHMTQLQHFIDDCDYLYLTIDLDVFPASTAPGVSAPAARGVSIEALTPFIDRILHYKNKLMIADIAEYNPIYDVDHQTARLAARLCWEIANTMAEKQTPARCDSYR